MAGFSCMYAAHLLFFYKYKEYERHYFVQICANVLFTYNVVYQVRKTHFKVSASSLRYHSQRVNVICYDVCQCRILAFIAS